MKLPKRTGWNPFFRHTRQHPEFAILIGCIFICIGGILGYNGWMFRAFSEPVNAHVTKVERKHDDDHYLYRTTFEIRYQGAAVTYSGNTWHSPAKHTEGEIVPARYSAASGEIVSERLLDHQQFLALMALGAGTLSAFMGGFVIYSRRKQPLNVSN